MTQSFDELLKHHGLSSLRWDSDNYANANTQLASEFYKAGVASCQAEVDELQKRIDLAIERIDIFYMTNGMSNLTHDEIYGILKGTADEQ